MEESMQLFQFVDAGDPGRIEHQRAVLGGIVRQLIVVGEQLTHWLDQLSCAAHQHRSGQCRFSGLVPAQLLRLRQAELPGQEGAGHGVHEPGVTVRRLAGAELRRIHCLHLLQRGLGRVDKELTRE